MKNLFPIQYPIIQAGMIWTSGAKLAAASSNAGILGLIGAGSMPAQVLKSHIQKAKKLTQKPFGVNLPLLYSGIEEQIKVSLDEGVRIFFTSAGSPKKFTQFLKKEGATVVHVVSTPLLAKKCEDAGVDAVVAEGFEAGGHNGRAELTTLCLVPQVVSTISIPVIAAGGIASGQAIAAAFCLGAQGVQIGSLFACSEEASCHENFKKAVVDCGPEDTMLSLKKLVPVRLLKNEFYRQVEKLESAGAGEEELLQLLGKGRSRKGIFEGDLVEGELEIGQIGGQISEILPVQAIVDRLISQWKSCESQKKMDFLK